MVLAVPGDVGGGGHSETQFLAGYPSPGAVFTRLYAYARKTLTYVSRFSIRAVSSILSL